MKQLTFAGQAELAPVTRAELAPTVRAELAPTVRAELVEAGAHHFDKLSANG